MTGCRLPVLLVLAIAVGCGGRSYRLVEVFGRVTLDGQPLAGAHVTFQPRAEATDKMTNLGPGSYGTTDFEGRFALRSVGNNSQGAVAGTHRVFITTAKDIDPSNAEGGPANRTEEKVPPRWRDGSTEFVVPPEGTNQANFDLTSS